MAGKTTYFTCSQAKIELARINFQCYQYLKLYVCTSATRWFYLHMWRLFFRSKAKNGNVLIDNICWSNKFVFSCYYVDFFIDNVWVYYTAEMFFLNCLKLICACLLQRSKHMENPVAFNSIQMNSICSGEKLVLLLSSFPISSTPSSFAQVQMKANKCNFSRKMKVEI